MQVTVRDLVIGLMATIVNQYNSFGNGSAMRVSPCAWTMDCSFCARTGAWPSRRALARLSAEVTHNHPEGVKGAMATSDAIFMCRYYFGGYSGDYGNRSTIILQSVRDSSRNT